MILDRFGDWLTFRTGYPTARWSRWKWVYRLADRLDPYRGEGRR